MTSDIWSTCGTKHVRDKKRARGKERSGQAFFAVELVLHEPYGQ